jgi:hypothetical protein
MLACRGGHGAVVQVLITAKVNLNIRNQVRPLYSTAVIVHAEKRVM